MKCPNCNVECVDNVCPQCNGYFDEDLLSLSESASNDDDAGESDDEVVVSTTVRHKPSKKHRPHRSRPPASDADGDDSSRPRRRHHAPETDSGSSGGKYVGKYDQFWEEDGNIQSGPASDSASAASASKTNANPGYGKGISDIPESDGNLNGLPFDPLQMCKDAWNGFSRLPLMERIYCGASIGLCFFSILPWYSYRSTDGFEESSFIFIQLFCFLLSIVPVISLIMKKQSREIPAVPPKFVPLIPVASGFAAALFSIAGCLYILHEKSVHATVGPFGAIACSAVLFLGSGGAGLFRKQS